MAKYKTANVRQTIAKIDAGMEARKRYAAARANSLANGSQVSVIRDIYLRLVAEGTDLANELQRQTTVDRLVAEKGADSATAAQAIVAKTIEIKNWIEAKVPEAVTDPNKTAQEVYGLKTLLEELAALVE